MIENKGENKLLGKWKFKVGDMPEVHETFNDDGTFHSEFAGTGHHFSGVYSFNTVEEPNMLDMDVKQSTLEKLPLGTYKSIFKVEGDTYKSCTAVPGDERPKNFKKNCIVAERI